MKNFKCVSCNGNKIEEIFVDAVVVTQVNDILNGIILYGDQSFDSGRIARYQCEDCQLPLINPDGSKVTSEEELIKYMKNHVKKK